MAVFSIMFAAVTSRVGAAPHGVTVPAQTTMTNRFLPYAGSGTQLIGNSPAWRDSAGVLGINNYLEGLETLTPGAAVNLDFSTWRTKRITLNQNTVFTAINIPSASTNVQTMLLEVIGDGAFTVSFVNVTWQTPEITTPEAGVVTLYALRGDSGAVKGYTQAVAASGVTTINPTDGYLPYRSNATTFSDSALKQSATNLVTLTNAATVMTLELAGSAGITTLSQSTADTLLKSDNTLRMFFGGVESLIVSSVMIFPDGPNYTLGSNINPFGGLSLQDTASRISWNGSTNSILDGWVNGSPESDITADPGSLFRDSTGRLFLKISGTGNTGWSQIATGSGSVLWSSSSGNLIPSPAVDVVSIQSQSADNATNNIVIIDTGSNWVASGAKLQAWRRNGTNLMAFGIGPTGSSIFSVGDNSSVIRTQIEGGTGDYAEVFTLGTSQYGYDLYADGSESYFELRAGGTGKLKFYPAAPDGVVPYIFDTSVSHTSTNLLEIANNGTNKVTVGYSGNVTASAFTPDLQTVSYASSVTVDFSGRSSLWTVLAGDMTLASANLAVGRKIEYRIDNQQATNCNVILPSGWRFVSGVVTNVLAASKIGLLTARSYSTTDTNVVAMWSSE